MCDLHNKQAMARWSNPRDMEITHYPVALCAGQELLLDGKVVAVVTETCLIHSRELLMQYIAAQNKSVEVEPDIRVEVCRDGVFLGFFSKDGKSAVLSLDKLLSSDVLGPASAAAISAWAADQRRQAQIAG